MTTTAGIGAELAEQPEDWTEPGAHPVVPGVHRIPVPLPMQGLHAVNVYVIEDEQGPILIDSGLSMPQTGAVLKDALRPLGHSLRDVREVLVTHAHWDHWTQALFLRQIFGTRVRLGRGEESAVGAITVGAPMFESGIEQVRRHGGDELADRLSEFVYDDLAALIPFGPPDEWLAHGDKLPLRDRTLEVFETPGHTVGHVVFRDAGAGLLFAGDHVLPHITPSIGLERQLTASPLRAFLDSLNLVRDLPDTLLLPAHGPVTRSVHTRVDELIEHHRERLDIVLGLSRNGAETAAQVAAAMVWTRRERRFADLQPFDQMLAILEVGAHLEVLHENGQLDAGERDGVRVFAIRA